MMKKIFVFALCVLMLLSACGCTNTQGEKTSEEKITVALLLSGSRGDGAYLDYVCMGADRAAQELPIELKTLEIADVADYESNLVAMADAGYDVVIGSSTQFSELISAHSGQYPDVKFIQLDGEADGENVVSANFSFKDGGYLAGVAAAMLSSETGVPGIDGTKVIGYIGGLDVPTLQWIEQGYVDGAHSVDPEIQVLTAYVGSFADPGTAKELAIAQIDAGANVIIAAAGGSALGAFEAAAEANVYCIGFDNLETGKYASSFFTTVERGIHDVTFDIIKSVVDDTWKGGEVIYCTVANGYCKLSDMSNFKQAIGDVFPDNIPEMIDKVIQEMKDGTVVIKDE